MCEQQAAIAPEDLASLCPASLEQILDAPDPRGPCRLNRAAIQPKINRRGIGGHTVKFFGHHRHTDASSGWSLMV